MKQSDSPENYSKVCLGSLLNRDTINVPMYLAVQLAGLWNEDILGILEYL